jgi:hypothetical protein
LGRPGSLCRRTTWRPGSAEVGLGENLLQAEHLHAAAPCFVDQRQVCFNMASRSCCGDMLVFPFKPIWIKPPCRDAILCLHRAMSIAVVAVSYAAAYLHSPAGKQQREAQTMDAEIGQRDRRRPGIGTARCGAGDPLRQHR